MGDDRYDMLYRIALVGDSGAGKTTIMFRYTDNIFTDSNTTTIGVDWKYKTMEWEGKTIKLQVWDTAGQERFSSLAPEYCRKADAVLLIYDITRLETFQHVDNWRDKIGISNDTQLVLVGNKIDMRDNRVVTTAMGQSKAEDFRLGGVRFFETSAKTNVNIDEVFNHLVPLLMANKGKRRHRNAGIRLTKQPETEVKTSSCTCSSNSSPPSSPPSTL